MGVLLPSLFEVLTTTRARSRKPFILYLYMKIICGKQVKVHFAYFVQLEQLRTIPEHLSLRKVLFNVTFLLQQLSWLLKIAPPNKVKKNRLNSSFCFFPTRRIPTQTVKNSRKSFFVALLMEFGGHSSLW